MRSRRHPFLVINIKIQDVIDNKTGDLFQKLFSIEPLLSSLVASRSQRAEVDYSEL